MSADLAPQPQRDPKQDPEPGDVVQMVNHSRHVTARSPGLVWFHAKCGDQWLNKTCRISLKEWREDTAKTV